MMFLHASDQISDSAPGDSSNASSEPYQDHVDDDDEIGPWNLAREFDQIEPVIKLNRIAKRFDALNDYQEQAVRTKAVDMLSQAFELRRDAVRWLIEQATNRGIRVEHDRDAWISSASDEEMDEEDNIVFPDSYEFSSNFSWHGVHNAARSLAIAGERDQLEGLRSVAAAGDLALDRDVVETLSQFLHLASQREAFDRFLRNEPASVELPQSQLIDRFGQEVGISAGIGIAQEWLELMEDEGKLQRYKKGNRWQVVLAPTLAR